jgi:hypothetical protein
MVSTDPESTVRSCLGSARAIDHLVLTAFWENRLVRLDLPPRGGLTIGRSETCDLRLDHPSVSRHHLRLDVGPPVTVQDLDSRNGTCVRGIPVRPNRAVTVQPGDVLECGAVMLILRGACPAADLDPAMPREGRRAIDGQALVVGSDGRWFQPPRLAPVNLGRRGPLRRILHKLAGQRLLRPGASLNVVELIEAGWPGERMRYEAGLARVYTTIQRLRALGLGQILCTRDDGYLLDPELPVRIATSPGGLRQSGFPGAADELTFQSPAAPDIMAMPGP